MRNFRSMGLLMASLAVMAVGACSSKPVENAADPKAAEDGAARNMNGVCKSAIVAASDANGNFPKHLAELVAAHSINPESLIDPRLGHTAMAEATEKDWQKIAADVDAHCDFYYAGDGLTTAVSPDVIVMYDKGGGPKRLVCFSDGNVERYAPGSNELKAAVKKSNAVGGKKLPDDLDGPVVK